MCWHFVNPITKLPGRQIKFVIGKAHLLLSPCVCAFIFAARSFSFMLLLFVYLFIAHLVSAALAYLLLVRLPGLWNGALLEFSLTPSVGARLPSLSLSLPLGHLIVR